MKLFKGFIALFVMLSVFSCKNEKVDMSSYMQERDSIMQENKAKTQQLDELNDVLATIATGLDSIAVQENILFRQLLIEKFNNLLQAFHALRGFLVSQRILEHFYFSSLASKNIRHSL